MNFNPPQSSNLYAKECPRWESLLEELAASIAASVRAKGIRATVKRRVKTLESLNQKQSRPKYSPGQNGEPVKDLLGLRVVVPFLEDVESAIRLLQRHWSVVEVERKSEMLSYREFAYDAVHLILNLNDKMAKEHLPTGVPPVCEVQVRTYLQEAWAEVEHELIYKSASALVDSSTQKKLAALNASLMLSDTIFQELRDHQKQQAHWGRQRFHELRKKAISISEELMVEETNPGVKQRTERWVSTAGVSDAEQIMITGIQAHNLQNYAAALDKYTEALARAPANRLRSCIHNHRGMALFMLNQEQSAIDEFTLAFEADPTNHSSLNNRALAWRHLGVVEQALADFDQSLRLQPQQPEVYFLKGQTYFELGLDDEKTQLNLEQALLLQPDYPEAMQLLKNLRDRKD